MKNSVNINFVSLAFIFIFVITCNGCHRSSFSPQLTDINRLADTQPLAALDSLQAIDPDTLSDRDRNYYDFLIVKCERRCNLPAQSDSLILKVIDYAARQQDKEYYPEALYTAGLVYTALGDQPTALDYYQNTIRLLPVGGNPILKAKVLSQTGRLLASSHFYEQATEYLTEALQEFLANKDTVNSILAIHLLANVYQKMQKPQTADSLLCKAMQLGIHSQRELNAQTSVYRAVGYAMRGEYAIAINFLKYNIDNVSPAEQNTARAHAARIYRMAGMYDSAYMFAISVVSSNSKTSKTSAYETLLSPEIRPFISADSLTKYYDRYSKLLANYYNENSNAMLIQQENMYNYRCHLQKRLEAEKSASNRGLWMIIFASLGGFAIVGCVLVCFWYKTRMLRLKNALIITHELKLSEQWKQHSLHQGKISKDKDEQIPSISTACQHNNSTFNMKFPRNLKIQLQEELKALYEENKYPEVDRLIIDSEIYLKLKSLIATAHPISSDSDWIELEQVVISASKSFKSKLQILSNGKLSEQQYQTALLIKSGFTSSQIATLIGRGKSTTNYRRNAISQILFNVKLKTEEIEGIIRLL